MKKQLITLSTLAIAAVAFVGCQTDDTVDEPAGAEMDRSSTIEDSSGAQGTTDAEDELRRSGSNRNRSGTSGSGGTSTGDSSDGSAGGTSSGGTSSGSSGGASQP